MKRLRVAIDPRLKEIYNPEICWVLRLLLSSFGWCWEEVFGNSTECDIAYFLDFDRAPKCRCFIQANLPLWQNRSKIRLDNIKESSGCAYPIYTGGYHHQHNYENENGCIIIPRDIIFDIFWLVTGQEELHWPSNKHGQFDLTGTILTKKQILRRALASDIGLKLQEYILQWELPLPIPRWPGNKQAAACMGHDVDYPEVIRWLEPLRIIRRQGIQGIRPASSVLFGKKDHWNFESWVKMEKSLNIHSAFYFVARKGSLLKYASGTPDPFYDIWDNRFRQLFKYLQSEHFEIGLHASYLAFESRDNFETEKKSLEEASGQRIDGNTHHYWHLNPKDPESTLLVQQEIGLKYDTSLVHKRYVGWRRGISWPFFPFYQKERRELEILEIPVVWMDDQLFGDRQDNPGDRFEILRALTDTALKQGGCIMVDIHNYVFDEILFPEWAKTYRKLLEYISSSSQFWVDTPVNIANHWIKRYKSIISDSIGLS